MLVSSHDGWTWIRLGTPGRPPTWVHVRRRTVPLVGIPVGLALAAIGIAAIHAVVTDEVAAATTVPIVQLPIGEVSHAGTTPELEPPGWSSAPAAAPSATVELDDTREPDSNACSGRRVPDERPLGDRVALTFDDGPDSETTPRIVEILRRHQTPATFFINGDRVLGDEEKAIVQELIADPLFIVGNHGWSHANLGHASLEEVTVEVDQTTDLLRGIGYEPHFFRFPFGHASCEALSLVRQRGLVVVGWHVSSADWCFAERDGWCRSWRYRYIPDRLRQDMVGFVIRQVTRQDGGIVLLHDRLPFTVETLEPLVAALTDGGFSFVSLDDQAAFPRLNAVGIGE